MSLVDSDAPPGQRPSGVTPEQRDALDRLLGRLETKHGIKPENIVGHGEIQGGEGGNRSRRNRNRGRDRRKPGNETPRPDAG